MDLDCTSKADVELNNSNHLQQLDSLLIHLHIGDNQLTAAEFVHIDSCIPTFNEWDDSEQIQNYIQETQDDLEDEEEEAQAEPSPNLSEALEMIRKLHLFASFEQPQLHNLISDLETQLTDIYLDSKAVKQSSITEFFSRQ